MPNKELLLEAGKNGKFFSARFVKKDGSTRDMVCRLGVTKHLKGGTSNLDPNKYLVVWDAQKREYRSINVETVTHVNGVPVS